MLALAETNHITSDVFVPGDAQDKAEAVNGKTHQVCSLGSKQLDWKDPSV